MKKKALGKGLADLIPGIEEEGFQILPIEKILPSSFQPRFNFKEDEEFDQLVSSIKEKGVLQPILVREKGEGLYECIAGERRLKAAKKAGLKEIPVIIKNFSDEEAFVVTLIENLQRKNLNPIEEAFGYKNLIEKFGYTQEEVAKKVGKDRSTITNLLRLLKLPSLIQQDIMEERLSVGHAKAILSLDSEEKQIYLRNLILKKMLSVRETEKLITRLQKENIYERKKEPDPDLVFLSQELSKLIGAKVEVKMRKKRPFFIFAFEKLEEAEKFVERLKRLYSS